MATFPAGSETLASLDSYIPEVWGEAVNEFFRAKLVAAPFFTDRSSELSGGGDTLYTPTTTEFTANSKSNGVAVSTNSPTDTKVTLSVNNWYEASFAIEDREAAQVKHSYAIMSRYAKNCGYAIAKTLDTAITTLFKSFSNAVGSSATNLADSDIRNAIAYIEAANVDLEECAFFFHPNTFWKQVQGIDKFSLAINSPVNDPTGKMPKGSLYGLPIFVTTQIQSDASPSGARANALAHPDAIHWATSALGSGGSKASSMVGSMGVRVQSNYIPEYLSTLTTADMLYGVVENRDTAGVYIKSPL